jgi:threonine/homoserine/homoserine lactone efflux protein
MNIEMISALMLFAFVSSITPGPNNLMLMASGANFGVRRSVQHILGVTPGFMLMIFLVGMGLAQIFATCPMTYDVLKVACVVFLVYLAWRIATAAPTSTDSEGGRLTTEPGHDHLTQVAATELWQTLEMICRNHRTT